MKTTFASVLSAMAVASSAMAQVTLGPDETFICSKPEANFCAGDSLSTNIIIYCNQEYTGVPGNCNDNLSGIDGENDNARCYESSPTAGDAACEYNGTVYPANGTPFAVPTDTAAPVRFAELLMKRAEETEECTTGAAVVTVTAVASDSAPGYTSVLTAAYGTAPSSIVVASSVPYPVATGYGSATGSNTTMVNPTGGSSTSSAALTSLLAATGSPTVSVVASSTTASTSATVFTGAASAKSVNVVGGLVAGVVGAAALLI